MWPLRETAHAPTSSHVAAGGGRGSGRKLKRKQGLLDRFSRFPLSDKSISYTYLQGEISK